MDGPRRETGAFPRWHGSSGLGAGSWCALGYSVVCGCLNRSNKNVGVVFPATQNDPNETAKPVFGAVLRPSDTARPPPLPLYE